MTTEIDAILQASAGPGEAIPPPKPDPRRYWLVITPHNSPAEVRSFDNKDALCKALATELADKDVRAYAFYGLNLPISEVREVVMVTEGDTDTPVTIGE